MSTKSARFQIAYFSILCLNLSKNKKWIMVVVVDEVKSIQQSPMQFIPLEDISKNHKESSQTYRLSL